MSIVMLPAEPATPAMCVTTAFIGTIVVAASEPESCTYVDVIGTSSPERAERGVLPPDVPV